MAYENLCMYCFENMNGRQICPHCGRDSRTAVPQIQLLPGSRVYHSRFLIGRALGQDASGIVYAAFDTKRESPLRVREYLPRDCAERLNDGGVVPVAGKEDQFEQGMQKLRAAVEGVDDPRKRHFYFEENGTAYIAQRKAVPAAPRADEDDEEEEERGGIRRFAIIAAIAVAVVVAAAAGLISLFNGAMNTSRDVVQTPTVDPNEVWIPFETPTPTPYVAPTFAALVDPELEWIEFDYENAPVTTLEPDSTEVVENQSVATPAPTPVVTPGADSSQYKLVNRKSDSDRVAALQKKLVELGWLKKSKVSGEYDEDTVNAVKALQTYVNRTFDPDPALDVDGIAGPKTQLWIYEASVDKPSKATATPKPTAVPADNTIQEGSSPAKVREVQNRLVTLGLMPNGSADGKYGAATATAVKRFQQRVNRLQGYAVLDVTGKMDALSQSFLKHYAEEWERLRKATATPLPTFTPTPAPEKIDETDRTTIDSGADPASIRRVQEMLIDIGMMSEGSADGKYGRGTSNAVMQFQQWVNTMRNQQTLKMTGIVDPLTRQYLEYCYDREIHPYATPTPKVTDTPTPKPKATATPEPEPDEENQAVNIGPKSPKASITYAQQLLNAVGLLKKGQINGKYDKTTKAAVKSFQQWVNKQRGKNTVPVDGLLDDTTRRYLEYCNDHDITVAAATAKPTEAPTEKPTKAPATEAPTAEPEDTPTEAPAQPAGEGGAISVGPDSEPESISFVQEMLSAAGLLSADQITGTYDAATRGAVEAFQAWVNSERGEDTVPVTGEVDDATRRYLEYTFDHGITVKGGSGDAKGEPTEAPTEEPTEAPEPEAPAAGEVSITVDGLSAGDDIIYVNEGRFPVKWGATGDVASYSVEVVDSSGNEIIRRDGLTATRFTVDSSAMNRGEVYTLTVGAKSAKGDVVTRKARFALPNREISAPEITVGSVTAGASTVVVEEDSFTLGWAADGDVECYFVTIADEDGNVIGELSETDQTSMTVRASDVTPGMRYTITVGALPVNGGRSDIQESTATFSVAEADETPEDDLTGEPEDDVTGEPEDDVTGEPEDDVTGEPEDDVTGQAEGDGAVEPVAAEPTAKPTKKPAKPTAKPTKKPAKPTAKPTKKPAATKVSKPVITVDGSAFQKKGVPYMTGKSITVSWMAEGKVDSYYVYIENAKGDRVTLGQTKDTSKSVSTSKLAPGKYTLYVGVMPKGGGKKDAQWSTYTFAIPTEKEIAAARSGGETAKPTAAPTPVVTEEPEQEEASAEGQEPAGDEEDAGVDDADAGDESDAEEADGEAPEAEEADANDDVRGDVEL